MRIERAADEVNFLFANDISVWLDWVERQELEDQDAVHHQLDNVTGVFQAFKFRNIHFVYLHQARH